MKVIKLTGIRKELNEAAQKRLNEFEEGYNEFEEPKCSNGKTAEYYENLGIPIPEDLKKKMKDYIDFDEEEDYDYYNVDVFVNSDDFSMAIDDIEGSCIVFTKSGSYVAVEESAKEVVELINSTNN
jgi:hypothetical protein